MTDFGRTITSAIRHIFEVVLIVFVVLKLAGVVGWPWWLVLVPLWVPLAFALVMVVLYFGARE